MLGGHEFERGEDALSLIPVHTCRGRSFGVVRLSVGDVVLVFTGCQENLSQNSLVCSTNNSPQLLPVI